MQTPEENIRQFDKIAFFAACLLSFILGLHTGELPGGMWKLAIIYLLPIIPLLFLLPAISRTAKNVVGCPLAAAFFGGLPGFILSDFLRGTF